MAKDLVLDVVARKNSKDLVALAAEFEALSKAVDDSNKSSQQNVKFSQFLDKQIAETQKQVKSLAEEFERTGNADVFANLRGADRNLSTLQRLRKQVNDFTGAEAEAKSELTGLDAVVQRLSADYFILTQDSLAPARAEFEELTDRQRTQAETVKILEQRYRDTGRALDQLDVVNARRDLERLNDQVEDLGGSFLDLRRAVPDRSSISFGTFVQSEIQKARVEVDRLAKDLSSGGGINVFGDLRKAKTDLAALEQIGKEVGVDLARFVGDGITTGGKEGAKTAASSLQGAFSTPVLGPILAGTIAGAVVVALPTLTSLIGAAFIGGGGLGVIGLGLASQIKSPAVQDAFASLKQTAIVGLQEAGGAFEPVLVGGIKLAESAFRDILPEIRANLDKLAVPAFHLFQGVIGFVRALGPGIDAISSAAVPFVNLLAEELPRFGDALSQMLKDISAGAPGAILAFHDLFVVIDVTLVGLGKLVEVGEKTFQVLSIIAAVRNGDLGQLPADIAALRGQQDGAATSSDSMSEALKKLGINLGGVSGSAKSASDAIDGLNKSVEDFISKNLTADQAAIRDKQSLDALSQSIKDNGNAWDINTQAGQRNQQALLDAIQAADAKRQADVANGKDAIQAAQDYDTEVLALLGIAGKAGDAKTALDKLKGEYVIDVHEFYTTKFINEGTPPEKFFHGLAEGGPVKAGQPYIVGENGPELFLSDQPGTIIPNGALQGLGAPPPGFRATPAAGSSSGTTITFAGDTSSAFATAFMQLVRTGVIQVA